MDSILFKDIKDPEVGVLVAINRRHLLAIVREIELPFTTREGKPDLAGSYSYFGPTVTFLPSRHFLGEPLNDWTDGIGRIFVLSCTCGFPHCWPLSVHIEMDDRQIVWKDFRQPHRGPDSPAGQWRYDGLGPFVFDRREYERQLSAGR